MTERARKEYMDYCLLADSLKNEGIAIGEKRGRSEAKLEAARNLIVKEKLDLEDIADCTGLPLKTIKQLAEQLKAEPVQTH